MEQTGFLYRFDERDYITGASPIIYDEIMPNGDWTAYAPNGEKQYKYATFDTMSCTTFSALNIVETWVNYYIANSKLTLLQLQTLNELGFMVDGKFNASDRFTAIMSNTMPNGNYFQSVWDSIRKDGLLAEDKLPFGGNSWNEYHDKTKITEQMKTDAKKILDIFDFGYEWSAPNVVNDALKYTPVQLAIPEQAYHAVEGIAPNKYFDSYEPYIKDLNGVGYAMKPYVRVKMPQIDELWVKITREIGNSKETLGTLTARNGQSTFTCKTLELPWLNNARNISCIPKGTYQVKQEWWWSKAKSTYLLQNVTGRGGIRLHSGNFFSDIQGCILLGNSFVDINADGVLDVVNSRVTITAFENFMQKKPFTLIVE